ncbi:MAG: hypothetical protein MPJ24_10350 [Pirellulaceae bacterium]|nr:hypothetical protein [Pirellulaceae bacterium]
MNRLPKHSNKEDLSDDPDKGSLLPNLSYRWALTPSQLVLVLFFCILFLVANYLPLHSDSLWSHLTYGHWILENSTLPQEGLALPLSQGVASSSPGWLAQILLALTEKTLGTTLLPVFFSLLVVGSFYLLTKSFFHQTGRSSTTLFLILLLFLAGKSAIGTLRPEWFGITCFAAQCYLLSLYYCQEKNLFLLTPSQEGRSTMALWVGLPLISLLWMNLDPTSIFWGWLLLVALGLEAFFTNHSSDLSANRSHRRTWIYLIELSFFITILNPDFIHLHFFLTQYARENFIPEPYLAQTTIELFSFEYLGFFIFVALLGLSLRLSKLPLTFGRLFLVVVALLTGLVDSQNLLWSSAIFSFALAPYFQSVVAPLLPKRETNSDIKALDDYLNSEEEPDEIPTFVRQTRRSFKNSLIAFLFLWLVFAFSTLGGMVLGSKPRPAYQLYGSPALLEIAQKIKEEDPKGLLFSTTLWGDWIVYANRQQTSLLSEKTHNQQDKKLELFIHGQRGRLPKQAQEDYLHILAAQPGWEALLDKYNVQHVLVDIQHQKALSQQINSHPAWERKGADPQNLQWELFSRRPLQPFQITATR